MQERRDRRPRITVAHLLVALLVLAVMAALPATIAGVVRDARTQDAEVLLLPDVETYRHAAVRIHLEITDLSESEGQFKLRARPVALCNPCPPIRIVLTYLGVRTADVLVIGKTILTLAPDDEPAAEEAELPALGSAILRYPFDEWGLVLIPSAARVRDDNTDETLTADDVRVEALGLDQPFAVSIQNRVPQLHMRQVSARAWGVDLPEDSDEFAAGSLQLFEFDRPAYIKTANVLLVVLIAATSLAAIFLASLADLAANTGALVLGIWGIRAILLGTDLEFVTAVDLALIVVIVAMLVLITARLLWHVGPKGRLWPTRFLAGGPGRLLRRRSRLADGTPPPQTSA